MNDNKRFSVAHLLPLLTMLAALFSCVGALVALNRIEEMRAPAPVADQAVAVDAQVIRCARVSIGDGVLECVPLDETPAPATETATSAPSVTPSSTETPTQQPTSTATATHTPSATTAPTKPATIAPPLGTPSAQTALCNTHNRNQWHGLYDPVRNCRYLHHHGDNPGDPAQCDPLLVEWLGELPTSISYPWQTTQENELKHDGYLKLCRVFARPGGSEKLANDINWVGRTPNAVVGVYGEFHRHPGRMDRQKPIHSYMLWVRSCKIVGGAIDWTQCGTFKTGGHAHMGIFHCVYKGKHCARPNDPSPIRQWIPGVGMDTSGLSVDPYIAVNKSISDTLRLLAGYPDAWSTSGTLREDTNHDVWDLWTTANGVYGGGILNGVSGWGYNWNAGFAILSTDDPDSTNIAAYDAALAAGAAITEAYSLVNVRICDYAPPSKFCRFDGSEHAIFTAYTLTPAWWDGAKFDLDGKKDGFVTMNTFADVRGNPRVDCASEGENCVPLILDRSPVGWAGWNAAVSDWPNGKMPGNLREYNPFSLPVEHGH